MPKNGTTKHLSPLQAQKRLVHGLVAAYPRSSGCNKLYISCREPARSNSQRVEGARFHSKPDGRKEREASAPNTSCNGGNRPIRGSHSEHAAPFPAQDFWPFVTNYDRTHSHDRYLLPLQRCSPPWQHSPVIYHPLQSMSRTISDPCAVANDHYQTSQQLRQPKFAPPNIRRACAATGPLYISKSPQNRKGGDFGRRIVLPIRRAAGG